MARSPILGVSRMSRPLLRQTHAFSPLLTQSRTFTISRHPISSPRKSTQHGEEDFYEYYLNFKRRHRDLGRILWPKQPVAPTPDLTLLGEQQSNADSVAYILDCFVRSHQRHADQPIAKTLEEYREAKPGSIALQWLLRSETTHELGHWEHSRLLKLIVHCLVAEGNLSILTEWILTKDAPAQSSSKWTSTPNLWRGQLLSYTVQAQAYWTQETLLLEASLSTYLSMTRRATGHVYIPHSLPASWLFNLLAMNTRPIVETSSFNYFRRLMPFWSKSDPRKLELNHARLPVKEYRSDPLPALRLLRKHKDPDWHRWLASRFNPAGDDSSSLGFLFFIETAQLLARRGRLDDAKWVLDLGRDMLPLMFQMRRPSKGSRDGPPAVDKRLPTPDEAAAGLVDSEGYFLSMVNRTSIYADGAAASTWLPHKGASDSPSPDQ